MAIVYVVAGLSALYGLGWFVFAFVPPPALLARAFTPLGPVAALPETAARVVLGVFWGILVPLAAGVVVPLIL